MLRANEPAPRFELPSAEGGLIALDRMLEDGPVVVYFYPADFTPACTAQACMVRDLHAELVHAGLRVVGISPQPPQSHRRFADKHGLKFTLLSDTDKAVARAYGVLWPLGLALRRATFLIGADGTIVDVVRAELSIGRHRAFLRRALEGLRSP